MPTIPAGVSSFQAGFHLNNIVEILRWRAEHQSNLLASTLLKDGEEPSSSETFASLDRKARAVAAALQRRLAPGSRVLLLFPPGNEFLAAFWGCLYGGFVSVPVPPPHPTRLHQTVGRLLSIIKDCDATVALTTAPIVGMIQSAFQHEATRIPGLSALAWLAAEELSAQSPDDWKETPITPETLTHLQYTSGSTSEPKGVMICHGNMMHNLHFITRRFLPAEIEARGTWLPNFHDMGLVDGLLHPTFVGVPNYIIPSLSFLQRPARWLQMVSRYRIGMSGGPNFGYELCNQRITDEELTGVELSSWVTAYNGAEPVRQETIERFLARFQPYGLRPDAMRPCYGMAETTLMITGVKHSTLSTFLALDAKSLQEDNAQETGSSDPSEVRRVVGCGRAGEDGSLLIVDPLSLLPCAEGQIGEIWTSSASNALGYWKREEDTKTAFQATPAGGEGHFLRTGDLGFLRKGELFITGRLKDLIIVRGRNHYPQDIEWTTDRCHPSIRRGCVAVFSIDRDGEERVIVLAEFDRRALGGEAVAEIKGIQQQIRTAITQEHGVTAHDIVFIAPGTIPKTSSGKVQRQLSKKNYLGGKLERIDS
jgi:acyl-CoA synthetase (AMP-forming)/AMP-acid ligase II